MRLACVFAGTRAWCRKLLADIVRQSDDRCLFLSDDDWAISGLRNLKANQPNVILGTELDCLVIDCMEGLEPDMIGAASGAVVGGGVMIFLRPPWDGHPTGAKLARRLCTNETSITDVGQRYSARFWTRLSACTNSLVWDETRGEIAALSLPKLVGEPWSNQGADEIKPARTADQAGAIEQIIKALNGRKNRPLVLTSDRGRGKTAALGIALGQSLGDLPKNGIVISPTRRSINPLIQQILDQFDGVRVDDSTLRIGASILNLLTPADCAKTLPKADFAIVDEAAALPVDLLKSVLRSYNRTVFSTTLHGYEGTGRGFSIRFADHLDVHSPNWRQHQLKQPIRWSENDPLEDTLLDALGLSQSPVSADIVGWTSKDFECVRLDPADVHFESGIDAAFRLLVDAHYRTTPMDLARLYDAPDTHVWMLTLAGEMIGVAVTSAEGGLTPELALDISRSRRRLRGHLVPQTLAAHSGFDKAPLEHFWRVVRIAVDARYRRRGAGRFLLNSIAAAARSSDIAYLGTSFGVTAELVRFWSDCGFEPVRLGTHRGRASGLFSMICIKSIALEPKSLWFKSALKRFNMGLPVMFHGPLSSLECDVVLALLRQTDKDHQLTPYEWSEIGAFARGERAYEVVYDLLYKFAFILIKDPSSHHEATEDRGRVWVEAILKGTQPQPDRPFFGLRSRAELVDRLITDTQFILAQRNE